MVETCTSCHEGLLIETIQEAGGTTKRFSCGHKLVTRTVSEQGIALDASVVVQQRLGPQSTASISSASSSNMSFTVVSMQQEMYKDALSSFEQAKKNDNAGGDQFETWKNLRETVIFSFLAIESCVNQFIQSYVDQNKTQMTQKAIDRWTEKKRHIGIMEKLNDGVELFGGKAKRLENEIQLWKDVVELKRLRDELVHYKVGSQVFYDTKSLFVKANHGIRTASSVIKKIYLAHPQNVSYPRVFDTVP